MSGPEDWPGIAHMTREELESEAAALRRGLNAQRDELAKVKGHRAELSERCYRKDLELDELRIRDRVRRDASPYRPPVRPGGTMTAVQVALDSADEIDGNYSGPEHVFIDLGDVRVTMTHEQARQLREKLDALL
jgi:hypothetical protein